MSAELKCMHHYLLFSSLFTILYCAPQRKKKNGKRLHYLQCGNSLLNHGNISMLNRA